MLGMGPWSWRFITWMNVAIAVMSFAFAAIPPLSLSSLINAGVGGFCVGMAIAAAQQRRSWNAYMQLSMAFDMMNHVTVLMMQERKELLDQALAARDAPPAQPTVH
ncbi:hypothetical protein EN996_31330 [Mesorhizobium sp. M7A.F.Ca.CA.002.14.1.2]|nr:hypothetical protein EN996_31330 [Mesorhizobium sp. M7A.F.Ca.CA.002.14.1.2]